MTRDKALQIILRYINDPLITNKCDFIDALKQATRDITYCLNVRRYPHEADNIPLPGETVE